MTLPSLLRQLANACPTATLPIRWDPYRTAMLRAADALEAADARIIQAEREARVHDVLVNRGVSP